MAIVTFKIRGTSPYMQNRFGAKSPCVLPTIPPEGATRRTIKRKPVTHGKAG